jgi:hypothetical protein
LQTQAQGQTIAKYLSLIGNIDLLIDITEVISNQEIIDDIILTKSNNTNYNSFELTYSISKTCEEQENKEIYQEIFNLTISKLSNEEFVKYLINSPSNLLKLSILENNYQIADYFLNKCKKCYKHGLSEEIINFLENTIVEIFHQEEEKDYLLEKYQEITGQELDMSIYDDPEPEKIERSI